MRFLRIATLFLRHDNQMPFFLRKADCFFTKRKFNERNNKELCNKFKLRRKPKILNRVGVYLMFLLWN